MAVSGSSSAEEGWTDTMLTGNTLNPFALEKRVVPGFFFAVLL